jgi:hypothetical protein
VRTRSENRGKPRGSPRLSRSFNREGEGAILVATPALDGPLQEHSTGGATGTGRTCSRNGANCSFEQCFDAFLRGPSSRKFLVFTCVHQMTLIVMHIQQLDQTVERDLSRETPWHGRAPL